MTKSKALELSIVMVNVDFVSKLYLSYIAADHIKSKNMFIVYGMHVFQLVKFN